eukprot:s803_g25.t2
MMETGFLAPGLYPAREALPLRQFAAPRSAPQSAKTGRWQQGAMVTTLSLALVQKAKGRRRHVLEAGPRFAPEPPPKDGDMVITGGPKQLARRKVPRWAPDGGSDPLVADRGRGGELDVISEEVYPGDGRCYRVVYDLGIGIRKEPNIGAKRTGEDLLPGECFEIKKEIRRAGRRYFELLDGRGWVFDWTEVEGERVELVELAAQLYTVAFPDGVNGIAWSSDATMRFSTVNGFTNEVEATNLAQAGIRTGDVLVMIDQDPVVGMPFGQVLERIWATAGRQPGSGYFYKVTTETPYGIGIRDEPDINGPRTGEDLIRGAVFEVDEMVEVEDDITYLHLADQRGWVFDNSAKEPDNPCVINLAEIEPGCTLTMWRGEVDELAKTIGLRFKQDGNEGQPFTLTVLEEGEPIQRVPCAPGSNLRKTLLANGFQVYQDLRSVFNCNAQQLCGTCVLDVMEGDDNLTVRSVNEAAVMSANPPSFRLCCNIDVYGDITVRLRPRETGSIKQGVPATVARAVALPLHVRPRLFTSSQRPLAVKDMGAAVQACVFTIGLIGVLIFMWLAVPTEQTLDLKFPNAKVRSLRLAALLEQKLTGLNSYFGSPNCLSVPDPGRSTLASTALPSSPSSAASQNRGSLRDSSEAPEDGSMPWVPAPVRAERCLARSGTIDEGSLSAQPQNLGKLESLSAWLKHISTLLRPFEPGSRGTLKDEFKFNKSFGAKVDGLIREGYKGWRRVRGDGNCFYRAVGYSLIEQIILSEQRQTAAAALVRQLRELQLVAPSFEDASQQKLLSVQDALLELVLRLRPGHESSMSEDLAALPKTSSTRDRPLGTSSQAVWPDFWPDYKGAPCFSRPSGKVQRQALDFDRTDPSNLSVKARFQEFSEIVEACSLTSEQAETVAGPAGRMQIQTLLRSSSAKVWAAEVPGSSCGFTCSRIDLHLDMPPEAVMWAIYNVDERLEWDGDSFEAYELLCEATPQSCSRALGDVVYCRFPGMAGVSGRDVVQERFLLCPDDPVGGCAIVMRSPQPSRCASLGRPPQAGWVRATSLLSGFHIARKSGERGQGIRLRVESCHDLGGNVPAFVVAMGKKAGKRKPLEWAQKLQDHCRRRALAASMSKVSPAALCEPLSAQEETIWSNVILKATKHIFKMSFLLEGLLMFIIAFSLAAVVLTQDYSLRHS